MRVVALLACILAIPGLVLAQGANLAFGSIRQDTSMPVEVSADTLSVDQETGTAVFTGNVVIGQGEMRLAAPRVTVVYAQEQGRISRLEASGGVTLVSGQDAAESRSARYDVDAGVVEMAGDVLLTQGRSALTSDKMTVDLRSGTARMEGRVKTVLQPQD